MKVESGVASIFVSKDDTGWVAAGTWWGKVLVWDATYERVFAHKLGSFIYDVDFSPDSTRLATVDSPNSAAKHSPQGDRIAVACSHGYVRVWDSNNGRPLVDIKVNASMNGLLWFNNHLFIKTNDKQIKQINATTRSTVSKWSLPYSDYRSCIALPQHGRFAAYSAKQTITFWDTSTHEQLCIMSQSPRRMSNRVLSRRPTFCNRRRQQKTHHKKPIFYRNMFCFLSWIIFSHMDKLSLFHLTSRGRKFLSTILRLMHGNMVISPMRKNY